MRAIRKLASQDKIDMLIGLDLSDVTKNVVPPIQKKMQTPLIIILENSSSSYFFAVSAIKGLSHKPSVIES